MVSSAKDAKEEENNVFDFRGMESIYLQFIRINMAKKRRSRKEKWEKLVRKVFSCCTVK